MKINTDFLKKNAIAIIVAGAIVGVAGVSTATTLLNNQENQVAQSTAEASPIIEATQSIVISNPTPAPAPIQPQSTSVVYNINGGTVNVNNSVVNVDNNNVVNNPSAAPVITAAPVPTPLPVPNSITPPTPAPITNPEPGNN